MNTEWKYSDKIPVFYESELVPVIFSHWAHKLIGAVTRKVADRVQDLACGTGVVARIILGSPAYLILPSAFPLPLPLPPAPPALTNPWA
jgi:hypothetical protein